MAYRLDRVTVGELPGSLTPDCTGGQQPFRADMTNLDDNTPASLYGCYTVNDDPCIGSGIMWVLKCAGYPLADETCTDPCT